MQYKYLNTYLLLGIEGVIGGFIMTVIIICIGSYTCPVEGELCDIGQPMDSFANAYSFIFSNSDYLVLFIFKFIFTLLFNVMRMLLSFYYTAVHYIIYCFVKNFTIWLFDYIFDNKRGNELFFVTLLAYGLEVIGVSIFLELIILGLCGANSNIEEEIRNRETEDYENRIEQQFILLKSD